MPSLARNPPAAAPSDLNLNVNLLVQVQSSPLAGSNCRYKAHSTLSHGEYCFHDHIARFSILLPSIDTIQERVSWLRFHNESTTIELRAASLTYKTSFGSSSLGLLCLLSPQLFGHTYSRLSVARAEERHPPSDSYVAPRLIFLFVLTSRTATEHIYNGERVRGKHVYIRAPRSIIS